MQNGQWRCDFSLYMFMLLAWETWGGCMSVCLVDIYMKINTLQHVCQLNKKVLISNRCRNLVETINYKLYRQIATNCIWISWRNNILNKVTVSLNEKEKINTANVYRNVQLSIWTTNLITLIKPLCLVKSAVEHDFNSKDVTWANLLFVLA